MKQTLFKSGDFTSHSGLKLPFKIDCDALSDDDIECIAEYIASKTKFGIVIGIPTGGQKLESALEKYADINNSNVVLIVDDVCTTGASMENIKATLPIWNHKKGIVGWVIFARTDIPKWINAMFKLCDA